MLPQSDQRRPVEPQPSFEHGNVLFIILIAVVLFAALSYAVTSSNRVGGNATDTEMASAFDAIQNSIAAHRVGIQRMVFNGIEAGQLDAFSGDVGTATPYPWTNPVCTSDSCRVYRPAGGGVPYFTLQRWPQLAEGGTPLVGGRSGLFWSDWGRQGSLAPNNKADLLLRFYVTPEFCAYFNKRVGLGSTTTSSIFSIGIYHVSGSSSFPLSSATNASSDFDALFAPNSATDGISGINQAGNLNYQDQGCSRQTVAPQSYLIMALVWAR